MRGENIVFLETVLVVDFIKTYINESSHTTSFHDINDFAIFYFHENVRFCTPAESE